MKKNKKNKISSNKSKSVFTQKVKEARIERKKSRKEFEKGIIPKKGMSKLLKSMGGVKKEKLSEEDKAKIAKAQTVLRETREKAYEARRIASLKRRYKHGEKTPEELKIAIADLKKSLAETKRYDILSTFPNQDKDMIKEMLLNEKIEYSILSDNYFWVRDTTTAILNKLREIMPSHVVIHPYKSLMPQNKPAEALKKKKPTNNTTEAKKAAKSKRKTVKLNAFKARKKKSELKTAA